MDERWMVFQEAAGDDARREFATQLRDAADHKFEQHVAETLRLIGRGKLRTAWSEASMAVAYGRLLFRAARALHELEARRIEAWKRDAGGRW